MLHNMLYLVLSFSLFLHTIIFMFKAHHTKSVICGLVKSLLSKCSQRLPIIAQTPQSIHAVCVCVTFTAVFVCPVSLIHSDSWNTAVYTQAHTKCVPADTLSTRILAITHTHTHT